jgi:hypothetical protein
MLHGEQEIGSVLDVKERLTAESARGWLCVFVALHNFLMQT